MVGHAAGVKTIKLFLSDINATVSLACLKQQDIFKKKIHNEGKSEKKTSKYTFSFIGCQKDEIGS